MVERRIPRERQSDLSDALLGRLKGLDAELASAETEMRRIQQERELVERLLNLERARNGASVLKRQRTVAEIVNSGLLKGVSSKDQFRQIATREGHEGVGRSVNAILMGYVRHEIVLKINEDTFELTDRGRKVLSEKAEDLQ